MVKQVKNQVKRGTKIVVSKVVRGRGRPTKVVKKVSAPKAKVTKKVTRLTKTAPKVTKVVRKRPVKVVQPKVVVQRDYSAADGRESAAVEKDFMVIGDCGSSAPDVVINLGNYQLKEKTIQRRNLQAYRNFEAVAYLIV